MATKKLPSTVFKKGEKRPGQGRPKGAVNKVNADLKAMILEALAGAGGVEYLITQADKKPAAFLALVGKVLPMTVAGDPNAPIGITVNIRQF